MNPKSQSQIDDDRRKFLEERDRQRKAIVPIQRLIFWGAMALFVVVMALADDRVRHAIGH